VFFAKCHLKLVKDLAVWIVGIIITKVYKRLIGLLNLFIGFYEFLCHLIGLRIKSHYVHDVMCQQTNYVKNVAEEFVMEIIGLLAHAIQFTYI
jgi:hypothetical protein